MDQQRQECQTNAGAGNSNVVVVGGRDDEYLDEFPAGWRFRPTHYELIKYYLLKKVNGEQLPANRIHKAQVYAYHPAILTELYRPTEGKVWFFFTSTTRKYMNGDRPNRAVGDYGYWKSSGRTNMINNTRNIEIGCERALSFYTGKYPSGEKTQWMMHEYSVTNSRNNLNERDPMQLDKWVLCKIYYNAEKGENPGVPPVQLPLQLDASLAATNHANQIIPEERGDNVPEAQINPVSSDIRDVEQSPTNHANQIIAEEGGDNVPEAQINPVSSDIRDGEQSPTNHANQIIPEEGGDNVPEAQINPVSSDIKDVEQSPTNNANQIIPEEGGDNVPEAQINPVSSDIKDVEQSPTNNANQIIPEEGGDNVPEAQINPVSSDIRDGEQSPPAI